MDVHIKRELVYENEIDEIDFDLYNEFGYNIDDDEAFDSEFKIHGEYRGYADAFPIKIETVIAELEKMKSAGSTHIEIGYHTDHYGYIFEGYKMTILPNDDVKLIDEKLREARESARQARIEDLKKELDMLTQKDTTADDNYPF